MMNAKKLMIGLLTGAMIFVAAPTTAFAGISFNFSKSESTSETTTVTDSHGNEYEVTHTVETVDGETTERFENVPFEITNYTGNEITELYISDSESDDWGENWLIIDGEECVLDDGDSMWGMTLNYSPMESKLDFKIVLDDGTYVEFTDCTFDNLEDGTHISMNFEADDAGNYQLLFEA